VERFHRTYTQECVHIHRPGTLSHVREVTEQFQQHYNYERPHQGLSCGNLPPRVAFPTLPTLPSLPETIQPDRWLESLHKQAFARKVNSEGCVSIDHEPYYIKQTLAGQQVTLFVNAPEKVFDVWQGRMCIKRVPIKGLHDGELPFEQYVTLMLQEARSEERRLQQAHRSLHQLHLWA
jgi:hypothetical protein